MPKKFFEICVEVLVPKVTRAEVRLPDLEQPVRWYISEWLLKGGVVEKCTGLLKLLVRNSIFVAGKGYTIIVRVTSL